MKGNTEITMKQAILNQSNAVRTTVLPEVKQLIDTVIPDYDSVKRYRTSIIDWLKPVVDLSGFYVYPTNGITEGLNWWMSKEHRSICMDIGDYQWVSERGDPCQDSIKYMSVPSSIDGNFKQIPTAQPIALDLAYVGSTKVKKIEITPNIEYVFYSLSKPFGIRNIRTGWYFTRQPDKKLQALTFVAKYYNYYALDVAEALINNFDIDHVYQRLNHKQFKICEQLDLTPSDSVWLANTTDDEYKKFRRQSNIARICLAGVMNEET